MIGHEVLLHAGDSSSRVMPVERDGNTYTIRFESDFFFNPDHLFSTVDSVMKEKGVFNSYIVEVLNCDSNEVVYSYEIGDETQSDLVPCLGRDQPSACYAIAITLIDWEFTDAFLHNAEITAVAKQDGLNQYLTWIVLGLVLLILTAIAFVYYLQRKHQTHPVKDIINIGKYQFDKNNMELSFEDKTIELTSKEADLLFLLHNSANSTIERENILKNVWGDEGAYVGRTLDVFISKLRKKLEADSNVKIVNIRGVGYKLIMNDQNTKKVS